MNELTVGIMAIVAQDEARRISEGTKAALTAAKAQEAAAESRRRLATEAYTEVYAVVREMHAAGRSCRM